MKNPKTKRILFISLFCVDIALTIFLFIVSIIMLATMPKTKNEIDATTFIGYLQANPTVFLLAFVIPLFILLAANVAILIWYVRKSNKAKQVKLNDLSNEEKEALRKELMKDLAASNDDKKEEE